MSNLDKGLEQAVQVEGWPEDYRTPLGMIGRHRASYHDFHKVNVKGMTTHVYTYVNGDQFTVVAGRDGVTQEHVDALNRAHNRSVESNLRHCLLPKTEADGADEAAEALALGMKPKPHKRKPILSLDGFLNEAGEDVIDSLPCFADPETVEGTLGLCESPVIDALREAIDALPPIEKRALQLVWLEGYPIAIAAKMEGCRNESTLRMRVNRAMARLRENEKLRRLYFKS